MVVVGYYRFFNSVCRRSSRIRVAFFVLEDEEEVVGIKSSQTKPTFCTLLLLGGVTFFPFFGCCFLNLNNFSNFHFFPLF